MSWIRSNITLVTIVIFLALLGFILTDLFRSVSMSGISNEAGVVAGEAISYPEFQDRVTQTLNQQGGDVDELRRGQIEDQVWDQIVARKVFENEFQKVGVEVTGKEIADMMVGEHVSPYVQQLFFGQNPYDREQVRNIIQSADSDPNLANQLRAIEEDLAFNRAYYKLLNIATSSYLGSTPAVEQRYKEQNRQVNLKYFVVDYTSIPDEEVPVSDNELTSYMEDHEEDYKQEEETLIRYALFEATPTKVDSQRAFEKVLRLKKRFTSTDQDSAFTASRSSSPYIGVSYQDIANLPAVVQDSLVAGKAGQVFGPIQEAGLYKLFKVVNDTAADNASFKIRHIQLNLGPDTTKILADANDIARQVRSGADFEALAKEKSEDAISKNNGGTLGWYRRGSYGPDFDDAISRGSVGSILGPIKSNRGYHIVEILDRAERLYDLAQIEGRITAGDETIKKAQSQANEFGVRLKRSKIINETASELNSIVRESPAVTEESRTIQQNLRGGRDLVLWAINADVGDVSPKVYKIGNPRTGITFIIGQVVERIDEGLQPLDNVRDEIEREVRNKKKAEIIKGKLAGLTGDLESMKSSYGDGGRTSEANNVSFNSRTLIGAGPEPRVIGRASVMNKGDISGPIAGDRGVFIIEITEVTEAAELQEQNVTAQQQSFVSEGQRVLQNGLQPALVELGDVEDTRAEFEAARNRVQ